MSLNIQKSFGALASNAATTMGIHQTKMGKAISHVSSGMRVATPSDDASAYITSRRIKADSDGYTTLANGIQTASAKLNVADSAVSSVLDILNAMKAKAIEYQNAAASGSDGAASINKEFGELTTVLNSALGIKYDDKKILQGGDGASANAYTAIYTDTAISAASDDDVKFGKISASWGSIAKKINDQLTASYLETNGQIKGAASTTMVTKLTTAINDVAKEQANIGAALEAMNYSSDFLSTMATAQDNAYSSITDADMAKEMTTYVRNNVLSQAAQAMISQANQSMAQVLNLLQ